MSDTTNEVLLLCISILILYVLSTLGSRWTLSLVFEILAGIACQSFCPQKDGAILIGQAALTLLVMEGGVSIDVPTLRMAFPVASYIALTGTILPCALGFIFMEKIFSYTDSGFAAGCSLSSTSIGMATKVLHDLNHLKTPLGGLICVAAMIDDVLSLVILSVLTNGVGGDVLQLLSPVFASIGVMLAGAILIRLTPAVMHNLRAIIKPEDEVWANTTLCCMLVTNAFCTYGAGTAGSTRLLGSFVAGIAFSKVDGAVEKLEKHEELTGWIYRIFFFSIGLQIPAADLFSLNVVGLGLLYAVPAILGKILTGAFACDFFDALIVGCAMVGRGELGFVMAQEALEEGLIEKEPYGACCWALLIATIISPFMMKVALGRKEKKGVEEGGRRGMTFVERARDDDLDAEVGRGAVVMFETDLGETILNSEERSKMDPARVARVASFNTWKKERGGFKKSVLN